MSNNAIVLRTPSGLSGDMLVSGLSRLAAISDDELSEIVDSIELPALQNSLSVDAASVNAIAGWRARVSLPHEHHHRSLGTIRDIIAASGLEDNAKRLSERTFTILAEAEAKIHGTAVESVTFHEVGALDSILDICVSAALFTRIAPHTFYCSPLPLCDGTIRCEHGYLASPAPAVQEMLRGVPVYGIDSEGETITPTAIAFLLAAEAKFGKWPAVEILDVARVYGGRLLPGVANGALFFLARASSANPRSHSDRSHSHSHVHDAGHDNTNDHH